MEGLRLSRQGSRGHIEATAAPAQDLWGPWRQTTCSRACLTTCSHACPCPLAHLLKHGRANEALPAVGRCLRAAAVCLRLSLLHYLVVQVTQAGSSFLLDGGRARLLVHVIRLLQPSK